MSVQPLGGLPSFQAVDASQLGSLQLEVGQQLFATVVEMVDDRALLDLGQGQRLAAAVETSERLQAGQLVQLQVAELSPDQVTLQLVSAETATSAASAAAPGQFLQSLGVPDDVLDREALAALMSQSQPVTTESLLDLRTLALSLHAVTPEDLNALAFVRAHALPATPATLQIVRQGLGGSAQAPELVRRTGELASQLLALLSDSEQATVALEADLRELLSQLPAAASHLPQGSQAIRWLMQQTLTTLERQLAALVSSPESGVQTADSSDQAAELGALGTGSEIQRSPVPESPVPGSGSRVPGAEAGLQGAVSGASDSEPPAMGGVLGAIKPESKVPNPTSGAGNPGSEVPGSTSGASSPEPGVPDPTSGAGSPESGVMPRLAIPRPHLTGVEPQLAARQLLGHLEHAATSGVLSATQMPVATALRDALEHLVETVQFHQIQNLASSNPVQGLAYLTLPIPLGDSQTFNRAELRVSYREAKDGRRIDPEDVHLAFQLDLSRLKRVTVSVHILRKQITCTMEAQNARVERLLAEAAPELRANLQQLGYAVGPIRCALTADEKSAGSLGGERSHPSRVDVQI